jgi:hypothetical protein
VGIYSTLSITRGKAVETVVARLELALARANAGLMSDSELTEALDSYLEPQLNNVRIVNDDSEPNDDERVPPPVGL